VNQSQQDRRVDFTKVKGDQGAQMRAAIFRFVRGYRGERKNNVTRAQILKHFAATPADFVEGAISDACARGDLNCFPRSIGRRARGGYVYEVAGLRRRNCTVEQEDCRDEKGNSTIQGEGLICHRFEIDADGNVTMFGAVYGSVVIEGRTFEWSGEIHIECVEEKDALPNSPGWRAVTPRGERKRRATRPARQTAAGSTPARGTYADTSRLFGMRAESAVRRIPARQPLDLRGVR
jgi:hypothetical protein